MAFITSTRERAVRKDFVYHVLINDLIKLGIIDHPALKTSDNVIDVLESPVKAKEILGVEP